MKLKEKILRSSLFKRFAGFSVVGAVVTLLSMLLTFVCNDIIGINVIVSYIIVYGLTILVSYILNYKMVFKTGFSYKAMALYFLTYLSSMVLGLIVLYAFDYLLPTWNKTIISYMVIPFTLTYNFFFASKILRKGV